MMTEDTGHTPEFKAKVALEALRDELMVSDLAERYGIDADVISAWSQSALRGMISSFETTHTETGSMSEQELLSKVGQLILEPNVVAVTTHRLRSDAPKPGGD